MLKLEASKETTKAKTKDYFQIAETILIISLVGVNWTLVLYERKYEYNYSAPPSTNKARLEAATSSKAQLAARKTHADTELEDNIFDM